MGALLVGPLIFGLACVSTTRYVRRESVVIRYNMGWTLVILVYLIAIGCLYYLWFRPPCAPTLAAFATGERVPSTENDLRAASCAEDRSDEVRRPS